MKRDMARRTGVISFFTLVSRILGFVRDAAIAAVFGVGMGSDAFYAAFRIPNLFRRLVAEGALTTSFVPVFTDVLERDPVEAKKVADISFTFLLLVMTALVAIGIWQADVLVSFFVKGFQSDAEKFQLTVTMTRLIFPYIGLISLMALGMGILHAFNRFAIPAFSPVLLNLALIAGAFVFSRWVQQPAYGLAIGALLGGVLQLVIQWPGLRALRMFPRLHFQFSHPRVKEIGRLILPQAYGVAVYQVNLFVMTLFASYFAGSVSYLWYAGRVMEFPLGIFAISVATAILPTLSRYAALDDEVGFSESLRFGVEAVLWVNVPAAVGLYFLAEPVSALLFHRGAFNAQDVFQTSRALQAFAVGLPFLSAVRLLANACYARKKPKIPALIATVAVFVNIFFCFVLAKRWQHTGLAFATTLGSAVNAIGLLIYLIREINGMSWRLLLKPLAWTLSSSALMALGLYGMNDVFFSREVVLGKTSLLALKVALSIFLGIAIYFIANLGNASMRRIVGRVFKMGINEKGSPS